jgi:hypothetical protein
MALADFNEGLPRSRFPLNKRENNGSASGNPPDVFVRVTFNIAIYAMIVKRKKRHPQRE